MGGRSKPIGDDFKGSTSDFNWKAVGGNDLLPTDVQARPEDGSNMRIIRQHMACFTKLEITAAAHMNVRNPDLVASMKTMAGALGFMPVTCRSRGSTWRTWRKW
jgi:hypothetical protein